MPMMPKEMAEELLQDARREERLAAILRAEGLNETAARSEEVAARSREIVALYGNYPVDVARARCSVSERDRPDVLEGDYAELRLGAICGNDDVEGIGKTVHVAGSEGQRQEPLHSGALPPSEVRERGEVAVAIEALNEFFRTGTNHENAKRTEPNQGRLYVQRFYSSRRFGRF